MRGTSRYCKVPTRLSRQALKRVHVKRKWLCIWEKDVSLHSSGYRDLRPVVEGKPLDVVRALGFKPDTETTHNVRLNGEELVYTTYEPLRSDREEVLMRFEGEKGDKTHLLRVGSVRHAVEATHLRELDRRHHRYPAQIDPKTWSASSRADESAGGGGRNADREDGTIYLEPIFVLEFHVAEAGLCVARTVVSLKDLVTAGRQPGNTVVLPHSRVSEHHATFFVESAGRDTALVLRDEGSADGCIVNNDIVRGRAVRVRAGDVVRIGPFVVEVETAENSP